MLSLRNVHAGYGRVEVLHGVSLHVQEGEIVTIVGANGAGKSTLLNAVAGLLRPTAGELSFVRQDIGASAAESVAARGCVLVPEGRQIFAELTVRENLELGAYLRWRREGRRIVEKDYEDVCHLFPILAKRRGQAAGTLSGGEQQMLALGRALMAKPRMLMLDEPSIGLAPLVVREILDVIVELRKQGKTFLLVEQNARAALSIADRGYVMETGRIMLEGTAGELSDNHDVRRAYLGKEYRRINERGNAMIWNEKYETMVQADLRQVQLERLQATLNRAERNVAFYRQAFAAAAVKADDVRTLADLARLPFTTKDDLRRCYPYDMFAVPLRDIVRIHSTSGTTGTPVVVGYTRNDLKTWAECVARLLAAGGMTEHDVMQVAFTYGLFSGGFGLHAGAERIGASVIPASTGSLEKQVRIMKDFKTTALACTPAYALAIASTVAEMGLHPSELFLRTGYFGAEPWSEGMRAQLELRLGITALDNYGLTEVLGPGVSFECEKKDGMHVNGDCFLLEVIDPGTLRALPAGTDGELVLTTITKEGFPLIRYRTGDIGSLIEEPCPCGRTTARMSRIRGRIDDLIIMGATKVFPSQVEQIVLEEKTLAPHCQLVIDRVDGMDTLEVQVEVQEETPTAEQRRAREQAAAHVARRLDAVLGIRAGVTLVEPRTIARAGEGKLRKVVDKRT